MPGPYVPPGNSPPFQVVDELHHGAWVIITVALGLVLFLVSFLIRLYVRLALHPPFGKDDYVLLGATIIAIIQAALLFEACTRGLGTSIDLLKDGDVNAVQRLIIVSDTLYLITLYTTKCCVVGIYLRLTPQRLHNRASWGTLLLCTLWVVPAILILTINCGLNTPWKGTGGQCGDLLPRWRFIVALDIATELILFGLSVLLLAGLFMPLKRKFTIAFAFVFRLPIIIFAILHIVYLQKDIGSRDPTLRAVSSLIWGQVELVYALVSCGVFCLRPFMAAVSTNYGTAGDSTLESSSRDASGSKTNRGSGKRRTVVGSGGLGGLEGMVGAVDVRGASRAQDTGRSVTVTATSAGPKNGWTPDMDEIELLEQNRGNKMMIRKDVQYTIEFDGVNESPEAGGCTHNESEYWDRYLEAQAPQH
ncbi:uncharacterized protein BDV17DRAFT_169745 [Aspergillus undulatus]|uniref:uncharacterized protein n=1 Tax=Aspergillus undulatus TaxID=1810928 RepID=UPI003CCE4CF9